MPTDAENKIVSVAASCNLLHIDLALLLLLHLQEKCSVDVRKNTTKRDGCSDQGVQLFITADGQLEMSGSDTLDLEILGGVTCKFENFGSQVLEDGGDVDGGCKGKVSYLPQA